MGMMVGTSGVVVRTAPYGNGSSSAASSTQGKTDKKKKYKRLNYNYREISGKILRAKTPTSAKQTVISARTKLAVLRRKYGGGEYDDKDLEIAIIHAEKMVRIAKKKLRNLTAEEQAQRTSKAVEIAKEYEGEDEDAIEMEEMQSEESKASEEEFREMIRQIEQELQELERENSMDELTDQFLGGGPMSKEDLAKWKKKHRCDEMRQIVEANMKYLKAVFQHMEQQQQGQTYAATLELGGTVTNTPVMISIAAVGAPVGAAGTAVDASI